MPESPEDAGSRGQLWHGRFDTGPAAELVAFTESLSYDQRLLVDDVRCSKAHVRGLHRGGLLSEHELGSVLGALDTVEMEFRMGELTFVDSDEDVHTAIERRVTELAGAAGAKLHTGRSRNDQVATAFRHYVRRELGVIARRVLDLVEVLIARAVEAGVDDDAVYLPGYTHLQQAQPVLLAHHLLAHGWALLRDVERLSDCRGRVDVSPLGAGALAGSSLPLDPDGAAADMGFAARFENSLDATSDRDFVAESLFVLALIGVHLSRMGEEVVLWSTEEFGFARLDDTFATGSSMLPQKKNPDVAELARGKAGRLIGDLTGFLATLKSLPLAYNRDLQEDKEPLFDALDTVRLGLGAMTGMYRTLQFRADRMRASADSPYAAATDLAEHLVRSGMPFREAHAVVGALVRRSLDDGDDLAALVRAEPMLGAAAGTRRGRASADHPRRCRSGARRRPARTHPGPVRGGTGGLGRASSRELLNVGYTHQMSIRYGECDQQGVVFNANYLAYIDDAMDHWMRSIASDAWVSGWDVMLKSVRLTWHAPARWSDLLSIDCGVTRWGRTSFDVAYRLHVDTRPVADALITYVSVSVDAQEPTPPPPEVTSAMGGLVDVPDALVPR